MYQRILVPLDGSPLAEQVLPYVRVLAGGLGASVSLLRVFRIITVVPVEIADPVSIGRQLEQITASVRHDALDYLDRVRKSLQGSGMTVSSIGVEGDPAAHIVREAEAQPNTLIAMSTHGRSGVSRLGAGQCRREGASGYLQPDDDYSRPA